MSHKGWWSLGGVLGLLMFAAPAVQAAEPIVIQPGEAKDRVLSYQQAAPTRYFDVEKAITLAPGQSRFGGNVLVGGLGLGGAPLSMAGGLNVRADTNIQPGLEAGISAAGIGAAGVGNLLADVSLRGKLAMTEWSVNGMPVEVAAAGLLGGFISGGGLTSGSVGIGFPLTAGPTSSLNVTLVPGLGLGFAAESAFTGTAQQTVGGFAPTLGIGADLALTDRLSALFDGRLGWSAGFNGVGNVGLRYGITDAWATDLFLGYRGNPLAGGLNTGTLGIGGFYAF